MLYNLPNMQELIKLHNEARQDRWFNRSQELTQDEALMTYAQQWADYMAKKILLIHSDMKDIMSLGFSLGGENIAYGQQDVKGVMNTWLNSVGHRRNIMNKSYDSIGCGFSYSDRDVIYWCVCFGNKK